MEVQEVKHLRVLQALGLQLRIRLRIRRHKGRRRNAEHVDRVLLLLHQLRPRHTHQLDADAHEPHVVDVRRDVGPRPGKTHPRAKRLGLCVNAVPELRREIVMHDELPAHDAVRLRVSTALDATRLPEFAHLFSKGVDDRLEKLLLVRQRLFLRDLQALVAPLHVDQSRRQAGERIAQHGVESRAHPWIKAAFQSQQTAKRVADQVSHCRAGVGSRLWTAGVRVRVWHKSRVLCASAGWILWRTPRATTSANWREDSAGPAQPGPRSAGKSGALPIGSRDGARRESRRAAPL